MKVLGEDCGEGLVAAGEVVLLPKDPGVVLENLVKLRPLLHPSLEVKIDNETIEATQEIQPIRR